MDEIERWILGGVVEHEQMAGGITRIRMSNRVTRLFSMEADAYLVGDILIDTGFVNVTDLLVPSFAHTPIRAIALTHNHEDHSGNCAALAREHHCPVYLRDASALWEEGVARMRGYRKWTWGRPDPFHPEEMPEALESANGRIRVLPTPGHSRTHSAFFHEESRTLFSGDLLVSHGVSAVMTHENPYESVASLRRVASLHASRMLTGHGEAIEEPSSLLFHKAQRIEEAATLVVELHEAGIGVDEILRRVFDHGAARDRFSNRFSEGEFSRVNFVRACLVCAR